MGVPTFRYHPEHGADIFDSDLVSALEKQGWKDTPAGMNIKRYNKSGCYTERLRKAGKSIKELLETVPTHIAEAKALLDHEGLSLASWMRALKLDEKNRGQREKVTEEYQAILEHLSGRIKRFKTSWIWDK